MKIANKTSSRRGFTLIEVLATLALVAIILPVAMQGITQAMKASSRSKHLGEATELASQKLNEITVDGDTTLFTGSGGFEPDWPDYKWQASFVSREYGLYEVTVQVSWKQAGQDESTSASTLVYPAQSTTSTGATQ